MKYLVVNGHSEFRSKLRRNPETIKQTVCMYPLAENDDRIIVTSLKSNRTRVGRGMKEEGRGGREGGRHAGRERGRQGISMMGQQRDGWIATLYLVFT